ncbi:MAG: TolC family protein [Candidatus Eisenbacteria bacterium]
MRFGSKSLPVVIATLFVNLTALGAKADEPPLRLDLDRCVEMALEVNVSVLRAGYDLDIAKNSVITSASTILPTVGVSASRSSSPAVGGVIISPTSKRSYTTSLYFQEQVTVGGVIGVFESLSSKRASDHNLRQVRQDVSYDAKQKYLEVLKTERLMAVRREALDLSQRRLDKAQALVDVGSAVKSDVLRAQVEVSRNELELISATNALRLAETDLRHFLAISDDVDLELEDILETKEVDYPLEYALSEATSKRPDIGIGSEALGAARAAVWRERSGWLPYLSINGDYRWFDTEAPDGLGDVWDDSNWYWTVYGAVDIFDGLGTFSRVRSAKASRKSAEQGLLQLRRDAALAVKRAFYNLEEAGQRVKVSGETVGLAEEELRLAEERFRLGGATMLEQIDSQVALSEARTSYVEALYDYLLSQAELVRAMGKD